MPEQAGNEVDSHSTTFATNVFSLEVIKKAAYRFTDRASFDFRAAEGEIVVRLDFTRPVDAVAAATLVADFRNEVLDQDLRRSISEETAPTRNAILAYAFSRTGLQDE